MASKEVTKKQNNKKQSKKQSKAVTILTILLVILAILVALAAFILTRSKPEPDVEPGGNDFVEETGETEEEDPDLDETVPADAPTVDESKADETIELGEVQLTKDEGWTHYLLLGVDGEGGGYKGKRSDAMIVLSVSKKEGRVALSSVPRDTYVYIDGKGFNKLNSAYKNGGAKLTMQTYEDNFDIDISGYITVNFAAMRDIVDELGGVTLTITEAEARHMEKMYGAWGLSGGTQRMGGNDVLAYCRIRHIGTDYARVKRQFNALMAIYEEVKDMSPTKYIGLIKAAYEHVHTDMILADVIGLANTIMDILEEGELESIDLVGRENSGTGSFRGSSIVMVDNLADVAKEWREALGIENYTPSSRVEKISKQLDEVLGR